jgi:hypothetical protein
VLASSRPRSDLRCLPACLPACVQLPPSKMARHFAVRNLMNAASVLDSQKQFEKVGWRDAGEPDCLFGVLEKALDDLGSTLSDGVEFLRTLGSTLPCMMEGKGALHRLLARAVGQVQLCHRCSGEPLVGSLEGFVGR